MVTDRVLQAAEFRARRLGQSMVRLVLAAACGVVGLGFLTAAAWLQLSLKYGDVVACLVVGLVFAVLALIGMLARPRAPAPPPPPKVGIDDLIHTFVMASELGRNARRR